MYLRLCKLVFISVALVHWSFVHPFHWLSWFGSSGSDGEDLSTLCSFLSILREPTYQPATLPHNYNQLVNPGT